MQHRVTTRRACRVCGATRLTGFLNLLDMPLTDDFLGASELGNEFRWPLRIFVCDECHVSQTLHDVDVRDYYREYRYSVAHSPFARRFMRRLAEAVWEAYGCAPGDAVIEVGSSDGAQLGYFRALGARVFGFEPSAHLATAAVASGVPVAVRSFDEGADQVVPAAMLPAQVIASTYTFDHLPAPMRFLEVVRRLLDPERGVLLIEVHDLVKLVERREYCLFAHEHAGYYTAATMQRVLERAGFVLLGTDLLPEAERRGNSLLVIATLEGSRLAAGALPRIELGAYAVSGRYLDHGHAIEQGIERFRGHVADRRRRGIRLAGYGAGGRGVMSLAAGARRGDFAYIVDANPDLHGYYTPVSHVPVSGPDRLSTDRVDEVVVFSFGYFDEIAESLAGYRAQGGLLTSLLDLL